MKILLSYDHSVRHDMEKIHKSTPVTCMQTNWRRQLIPIGDTCSEIKYQYKTQFKAHAQQTTL